MLEFQGLLLTGECVKEGSSSCSPLGRGSAEERVGRRGAHIGKGCGHGRASTAALGKGEQTQRREWLECGVAGAGEAFWGAGPPGEVGMSWRGTV